MKARSRSSTTLACLVCFGASLLDAREALAQSANELEMNLPLDVGLTLGLGAYVVGTELGKPALAPEHCRLCAPTNRFDEGVRNALRWDDPRLASTLSNVSAFGVFPLTSLGALTLSGDDWDHRGEDLLIVAESFAIAAAVNQTTKFLVGRERPFVGALGGDAKNSTDSPADNNLSFYSGHTSLVASLSASSATVASLRGYDSAPYLWGMYGAYTLLTAYLRVAADKHYASDVLVGALVGTAIGVAVPCLLHPVTSATSASAIESGAPPVATAAAPFFSLGSTF